MAKVHKAHKSTKKYGFQKKKINVKTLLIALAVVVVAAIGLKIAYDNYVYGEFEITAPTDAQLNNIADNWALLNADSENFYNYYTMYYELLGYDTTGLDGTDGSNGVHLYYTGNDKADEVYIYVYLGEDGTVTEPDALGVYARTSLTNFINGEAPWGQTGVQLQATNARCYISVYDADVETVDDALLGEVIAEIEALITAAQEAPIEEAAEESTEAAE